MNEVCGPGHGIPGFGYGTFKVDVRHAVFYSRHAGIRIVHRAVYKLAVQPARFFIRAATYYSFTSEKMWALMRRNYDGSLTTSGVGKVMGVYYNNLGDRVIQTTSIPQDDSLICEKSSTAARFSVRRSEKAKTA